MNETKNDILYSLNVLIGTLNNINVCGEQNCANIVGSIKMLRDLCGTINKCNITMNETEKPVVKRAREE